MTNTGHEPTVRCNYCMTYFNEEETGAIFECPKCQTDDYLMDLQWPSDQLIDEGV